jgi:hypothetical protein
MQTHKSNKSIAKTADHLKINNTGLLVFNILILILYKIMLVFIKAFNVMFYVLALHV